MTSLQKLAEEARVRRAQFSRTLLEVQNRLTPSGLAHEALGLVSPQFTRLQSVFSAVKRHPILAASVVAGAGWLFKQALRISFKSKRGPAHGRKRARTLSSNQTGKTLRK